MLGVAHQMGTTTLCVAMSRNDDGLIKSLMDPNLFAITGWTIDFYDRDRVDLGKTRCGHPIDVGLRDLATVKLPDDQTRTSATCAASKIAINSIKTSDLNKWNLTELVVGYFDKLEA